MNAPGSIRLRHESFLGSRISASLADFTDFIFSEPCKHRHGHR